MTEFLDVDDLRVYGADVEEAKGQAIIDDVQAEARNIAPCLSTQKLTDDQVAYIRSLLRRVALRWLDAGSGVLQQTTHTAGSVSVSEMFDSRQGTSRSFYKNEVIALVNFCKQFQEKPKSGRAFSVDMTGGALGENHQPWCSITWGWPCSCGANLTCGEYPLWEYGYDAAGGA